jgi:hypothetical protein
MIVESRQAIMDIFELSQQQSEIFAIPIFADVHRHPADNTLSLMYLATKDKDFIIPINHPDSDIQFTVKQVEDILAKFSYIYVNDKKEFLHAFRWGITKSRKVLDLNLAGWFITNKPTDSTEISTTAHDFIERRYISFPRVNTIIPIYKHLEKCRSVKETTFKRYSTDSIQQRQSYTRYNEDMLYILYAIESAGLNTDSKLEYTQYNPYTSTGRPSNRYGGINYAALNKEDGSRERFISRFQDGKILEFDFDAYHIRLMAEVVGYKFPDTSVHEYLGKQYFDKDKLTEDEYKESKALSFKILYGGIPKEMRDIEFFGKVHKFTRDLWKKYKSEKFITTYLLQRRLHADNLTEMNAPKLFNYYLQALETESNVLILKDVFKVMSNYKSKLILYTYDSFTFDFNIEDGKQFYTDIEKAMKYPVKGQIGNSYNSLKPLVFEHAL